MTTIAAYTQRKMDDLNRDGFTIQIVRDLSDKEEIVRQRGRMYNAANRLGVKITTELRKCNMPAHEQYPGSPFPPKPHNHGTLTAKLTAMVNQKVQREAEVLSWAEGMLTRPDLFSMERLDTIYAALHADARSTG